MHHSVLYLITEYDFRVIMQSGKRYHSLLSVNFPNLINQFSSGPHTACFSSPGSFKYRSVGRTMPVHRTKLADDGSSEVGDFLLLRVSFSLAVARWSRLGVFCDVFGKGLTQFFCHDSFLMQR